MDTRPATPTAPTPTGSSAGVARTRRKRPSADDHDVRYFLPKPGSNPDKPELGREMPTEGEAPVSELA